MYCMNCGTQIEDGAKFCYKCGWRTDVVPGGSAPGAAFGATVPGASSGAAATGAAPGAAVGSATRRKGATVDLTGALGHMADALNEATGGTGHVNLKISDFFTNVPKKHKKGEAAELFACGAPSTTPDIRNVSSEWPKPWVYSRVFIVLLITLIGCMLLWQVFQNELSFPDVMFVGALLVPFTVLIFFFETNVPRNISIADVVLMFFTGGIGAIILIYPLGFLLPGSGAGDFLPSMLTGIIEEAAKILMVVFFMSRMKGPRYILNGLLIGAAVGAGFAVFESAGYAFDNFLAYFVGSAGYASSDIEWLGYGYAGITESVAARAVMAIGGHVAWAAAEGAAIAICQSKLSLRAPRAAVDFVQSESSFSGDFIGDPRFLVVAITCIVLHGLWDMTIPFIDDLYIPVIVGPKYVVLVFVIWFVLVVMMNRGLSQINDLTAGLAAAGDIDQFVAPKPQTPGWSGVSDDASTGAPMTSSGTAKAGSPMTSSGTAKAGAPEVGMPMASAGGPKANVAEPTGVAEDPDAVSGAFDHASPAGATKPAFCSSCGAPLKDGTKFCGACGKPVE